MESSQNNAPPGPPFSTKVQGVYLIPRGTIKKTVNICAALLMITAFAAFSLEGIQNLSSAAGKLCEW